MRWRVEKGVIWYENKSQANNCNLDRIKRLATTKSQKKKEKLQAAMMNCNRLPLRRHSDSSLRHLLEVTFERSLIFILFYFVQAEIQVQSSFRFLVVADQLSWFQTFFLFPFVSSSGSDYSNKRDGCIFFESKTTNIDIVHCIFRLG